MKVCFSDAKGLEEFNSHPAAQAEVIAKLGLKAPKLKLMKPTSVSVAPDGSVFLADGYGASVIHRYSPDLKYLGTIREAGASPQVSPLRHGRHPDHSSDTPRL